MNTQRDKFLTEAMDEEWHRCDENAFYCDQCRNNVPDSADFSTPDGFFKLWDFILMQPYKTELLIDYIPSIAAVEECVGEVREVELLAYTVSPDRFANAVYEFIKNLKN